MNLKPVIRIGMVLLGIVLVIGAFAAVLMFGVGTNPPPLHIAVVVRDLQAGERLQTADYRVVEQIIDPRLAALYVQEGELPLFASAYIVDGMRRGDPISKIKLAIGDAGLASRRYALALKDPGDVIMTLPVNPDIIPSKIAPGDFINILFSSGGTGAMTQLPVPPPTAIPDLPTPLAIAEPVTDTQLTLPTQATPSPTLLAPPPLVLPIADLMLEHVPVLDVNYEQLQNPNYVAANTDLAQPFISGAIKSIVVKVPRSHQTLLTFGASTSQLRYAIASPTLDAKNLRPELGMDWATYIEAYRWKQAQVLARGETITQTLYPSYTAQTR